MSVIEWNSALTLDDPVIDPIHIEFCDRLNALADASDAQLPAALDAFVAHCEHHFTTEEEMMEQADFGPKGCHQSEHGQVMMILYEVRKRLAADGDTELARNLAAELPAWFEQHASTMDHAFVQFMKVMAGEAKAPSVRTFDLGEQAAAHAAE